MINAKFADSEFFSTGALKFLSCSNEFFFRVSNNFNEYY